MNWSSLSVRTISGIPKQRNSSQGQWPLEMTWFLVWPLHGISNSNWCSVCSRAVLTGTRQFSEAATASSLNVLVSLARNWWHQSRHTQHWVTRWSICRLQFGYQTQFQARFQEPHTPLGPSCRNARMSWLWADRITMRQSNKSRPLYMPNLFFNFQYGSTVEPRYNSHTWSQKFC